MYPVIEALALDLDGTLVDTALDIGAALNAALTREGLPRVDMRDVRAWIGDGPDVLISRALTSLGQSTTGIETKHKLRRDFDAATLDAPMVDGKVYAGISDLLMRLYGELPMVVITNKPTKLARAVIEAAGLEPMITKVWGADTPIERKPQPTLLLRAAAFLGIPPAGILMVGDGLADLLSARNAGCPAVLAGWGYGSHDIPSTKQCLRVESPAELQAQLLKTIHTKSKLGV